VRAQAAALGLTAAEPAEVRGLPPFPLVADISVTPRGLALALARTAPDGICSSSGSLHASVRIPGTLMYGRNATLIVARAHARALIPEVLELMSTGRLQPERVTTAVAPIGDAPAALAAHVRGGSTKTIIHAA
jgi:alcohol dehydrogenase